MSETNSTPQPIVVAMSGGVDSSVAAYLLAQQGHPVVGVSMQVWDYRQHGGCSSRATCCAPDDFTDARKVAAKIGVPYYVFDFENHFKREVIDRFVAEYQAGRTPNPCVDCNSRVKFRELRSRAKTFGARAVATGHYAQITEDQNGWHLWRGSDPLKDQSYFLYMLDQNDLATSLFPVGGMTKSEVREIARQAGLVTADKAESQDVCFVSGSVGEFVARIGGQKPKPGKFVNAAGEVLGGHDGLQQFTVGQRRGLNIGGSAAPLYVTAIDAVTNTVTVGPREALETSGLEVDSMRWTHPRWAVPGTRFQAMAQLRHRHAGVLVEVEVVDSTRAKYRFAADWSAVSPGQAAVLYDLANREVLGGGTVERAISSVAGG